MPDIDFARAKLLMDTIVSAGQHGPMYQKLAGAAGEELKKMMEFDKDPAGQLVTPPDGPANSAIDQGDGTYIRKDEVPVPNTAIKDAPTPNDIDGDGVNDFDEPTPGVRRPVPPARPVPDHTILNQEPAPVVDRRV